MNPNSDDRAISPIPKGPGYGRRLRNSGIGVGCRRALCRMTTGTMRRVVVGLVQMATIGAIALALLAGVAGILLPLSVALLAIALNLLGAVLAFIACGLLVIWALSALCGRR